MDIDEQLNLDRVCDYLTKNNIQHVEIIKHDVVKTMNDVLQVIHDHPSTMIKAILLKVNKSDFNYILLGIPADRFVDLKLVAQIIGVSKKDVRFATSAELFDVTGFKQGALVPFSLGPALLPFIIDSSFSQCEYVYCGAGTHYHSLKMVFTEIEKLPGFSKNLISKSSN